MLINRLIIKIVLMLALCVSLSAFMLSASAAPTPTINYQGKLTDATGVAVANGTYNMRFYLYNSTGGATTTAIWTEVLTGGNQVQVTNGLFSVMLGSTTPLTSVNFNQQLYLGVEIGGTGAAAWDGEMSPRKELGTVPAAFESYKLGGVASSSFIRSDQDDTASGLLNFTGGILSSASSTISNLSSLYSTTTNLIVNGERFTDLTGSGFLNISNALSCATSNGSTFGCLSGTDWTSFNSRLASSSIDTYSKLNTLVADVTLTHNGLIDTSAKLAGILSDETGTGGGFVRAISPVLTTPTLGVASATSVNVSDITKYTATVGVNSSFDMPSGGAGNTLAYSPVSKALWHDRLAFSKAWGSPIFETFNGSWASSTLDTGLFSQQENRGVTQIDGTTKTAARWIWNSSTVGWSGAEWWVIGVNYNAVASSKDFLVESSADGSTWTTRHTSTANTSNAQAVLLSVSNWSGDSYVRLTITVTNGQPLRLSSIRALSSRWGDQGGGSEQEYPYLWDSNQRIAFGSTSAVANGLVTIGSNTTSAADGLYFGTDTNLYRSAANQLKTDDGLIITGNVGIGTTSPYAKLSITGDLALTGGIYDNNATRGTNGQVLQTTGTGVQWVATSSLGFAAGITTFTGLTDTQSSLTANRILFANSGGTAVTDSANFTFDGTNLGIGTAAPATRLDITNSATSSAIVTLRDVIGNASLELRAGTSTLNNTFIGLGAGQANTTGSNNAFVGRSAGYSNTTGSYNTANGYNSLFSNTTGSSNTANGNLSLLSNTTGSNNTANGISSLRFNTTGSYNIANGVASLWSNGTGSNNTATGYLSLYSNTTGSNNTALGYQAGYNVTTGYDNIFIGHDENTGGTAITTGFNNIGLGYNIKFPATTTSNMLNIGNFLFANLPATTTATTIGNTPLTGKLGVGTFSPYAKLTVWGQGTGTGQAFEIANNASTTLVRFLDNGTGYFAGNIGIGTTSPYAKLSVSGNIVGDYFAATNATATSTFAGNVSVGSGKSYNINGVVALGTNGFGGSTVGLGNTYSNSGTAVGSSNTATDAVAVAVGYLNSATGLGSAAIGGQNTASAMGSYAIGYLNFATNMDTIALGFNNTASYNSSVAIGYSNNTTANGAVAIGSNITNSVANSLQIGPSDTAKLSILSTGNVGIGTTSPYAKLSVTGDLALTGGIYDNAATRGTNGQILQTTGTGVQWTSTSTLGLGNGTFTGLTDTQSSLTANRILFANSGGTAVTDSANFTFDGTNLGLGASSKIGFGGTNYLYASSTNDSVAFGENAGATFNSDTTYNTALGFEAGRYASTSNSDFNNFIGYRAGYNNTGQNNNFIGQVAGQNNTGNFNNSFGPLAGYNNTGLNNNFLGFSAGENNTGSYNNLLGNETGKINTGSYNNIFGRFSGYYNTGANNNMFGTYSGYNNTGQNNNFLGYLAGDSNTGSYNNFLGYSAGRLNTGSYNEMFGFETGSNLQATSSIIIGSEAFRGGAGSTAFQAINNTAIGYRAGYNASTSADNNILLGYQAADNLTTGNNNIVIGYDVDLTTATAVNTLNIGNLIFGTGIDGTSTTLSSGNIGIGTTSPAAKLSVAGNTWLDSNVISFASSSASSLLLQYFTEATSTIKQGSAFAFTIATSSSASPIFRIDTSGAYANTMVDGSFTVNNGAIAYDAATNQTSITNLSLGNMSFENDAGVVSWTDMGITAGASVGTAMSYTAQLDGNPLLTVYGEANGSGGLQNSGIGIGTTTPWARFSVIGSATDPTKPLFTVASSTGSTLFHIASSGNVGIGTTTPAAGLSIQKLAFSGAGVVGLDQYLQTTNSVDAAVEYGNRFYLDAANTATTTLVGSMLRIKDNTTYGNVVRGFEVQTDKGTNTQGENTALSGFARTFGVRGVTSGDAGGTYEPAGGYFQTQGTTQGNAIRGYSDSITTASLFALFQDTSNFQGTGIKMNFGNTTGSFSSTTSKYLDFQNGGSSVFTVSAYGTTTIGDGTTNHMAGLQIGFGGICVDNDGNCTASTTGRITAVETLTGNSDLAEVYFSSTNLKPGEIVTLTGGLSVDRAEQDSVTPVLGVVSTKPGLTLGYDDKSLTKGEDAYPIALSGRVPVQLSTENGPITKGDQLMLSSLPGVAMKATGTGATIGIALEDFDDTRMFSDTYLNQFGDDMVDPVFESIKQNTDPRINDGCYYSGGNAVGEELCVPLKATSTNARIAEANKIIEQESVADAIAELRKERSDTKNLGDGSEVRVGQVVMFVDRGYRWMDDSQLAMIGTLMGTTSLKTIGKNKEETVFDRLVTLANNFVDGVLSIFTLKADRVEVAKELCVDGVCINANDLRHLLDNAAQGGGTASVGAISEVENVVAPEPEPVVEEGSDEVVVEVPVETNEVVTPPSEIIIETPSPEEVAPPAPVPEPTLKSPLTTEPIPPTVPEITPATP